MFTIWRVGLRQEVEESERKSRQTGQKDGRRPLRLTEGARKEIGKNQSNKKAKTRVQKAKSTHSSCFDKSANNTPQTASSCVYPHLDNAQKHPKAGMVAVYCAVCCMSMSTKCCACIETLYTYAQR